MTKPKYQKGAPITDVHEAVDLILARKVIWFSHRPMPAGFAQNWSVRLVAGYVRSTKLFHADLIPGAPAEDPKDWVIRKRGMFYRAKRSGYAFNIHDAGRYTEKEAKAEAAIEPWSMSAHPVSEFLP